MSLLTVTTRSLKKEEQLKLDKLKGLALALTRYVQQIEEDENPNLIKEALDAIVYYQKMYFTKQ